eukprot:TRINITY_DN9375_c0_g1_i7.p2 TRINITY_DN9375_c0_g1~~TRINITY_DN9375_c0_g1_i7.p2  ORF type:complete len:225 (+),score=80.23 TRINITY_DN9375_c0_g1_i7:64-675(+)
MVAVGLLRQGNKRFRQGRYRAAASKYSRALRCTINLQRMLLSKRAACYTKQRKLALARRDANEAAALHIQGKSEENGLSEEGTSPRAAETGIRIKELDHVVAAGAFWALKSKFTRAELATYVAKQNWATAEEAQDMLKPDLIALVKACAGSSTGSADPAKGSPALPAAETAVTDASDDPADPAAKLQPPAPKPKRRRCVVFVD